MTERTWTKNEYSGWVWQVTDARGRGFWEIKFFSEDDSKEPYITAPTKISGDWEVEVDVTHGDVYVCGKQQGGWDGDIPASVVIPFVVFGEIARIVTGWRPWHVQAGTTAE